MVASEGLPRSSGGGRQVHQGGLGECGGLGGGREAELATGEEAVGNYGMAGPTIPPKPPSGTPWELEPKKGGVMLMAQYKWVFI